MAQSMEKDAEVQVAIAMSVAGIWAAEGVPVVEKRRLAARAATAPVLAAAGRGPCPTITEPDDIGNFELAMCEVRRGCGPRTSVAEAIGILRDRGVPELASRLRKVSSRRNRQSHPDPGLPGDLGSFFSGRLAGCSGSEQSEASLLGAATRSPDQVLSCASSGVGSPAGAAAVAKGTRGRGVHCRLEALENRVRFLEHRLEQASQCDALDVWFADDKEESAFQECSDVKVQSIPELADDKVQAVSQEVSAEKVQSTTKGLSDGEMQCVIQECSDEKVQSFVHSNLQDLKGGKLQPVVQEVSDEKVQSLFQVLSDGKVQSVTPDCSDEKVHSIIQELSDSDTVGGTVPTRPPWAEVVDADDVGTSEDEEAAFAVQAARAGSAEQQECTVQATTEPIGGGLAASKEAGLSPRAEVQAGAKAVATAEPSPTAAAERLLAEAVQPRHRGKRRRRRALAVGRDEVVGLPEAVVAAAAVAEAAVAALGARSAASERMAATAALAAANAAVAAFEASLDRARQAAAEAVAAEAEARPGGRAAARRLARARAACRSAVLDCAAPPAIG